MIQGGNNKYENNSSSNYNEKKIDWLRDDGMISWSKNNKSEVLFSKWEIINYKINNYKLYNVMGLCFWLSFYV